jgi:mRNA-degrading endonuclease RelE of RelBE toxin-antitoxin system
MKVLLSSLAKKQLKKLLKLVQFSVAKRIRDLGVGNEIPNVKFLAKHKNIFRTRISNYRMVYRSTAGKIFIILIEHRKRVYETLKRIL